MKQVRWLTCFVWFVGGMFTGYYIWYLTTPSLAKAVPMKQNPYYQPQNKSTWREA